MSFISNSKRKIYVLLFFVSLISVFNIFAAEHNKIKNTSKIDTIPNSNENNWAISVDVFAWLPSQDTSAIWADVITIGNNTSTWNAKGFDFNWDYGFKMGTQFDLDYDLWDIALYWSWFDTNAKHYIPFDSNGSISPEFYAAFLSGDSPSSMRAKWDITYNMFDLELGKKNWFNRSLFLRLFFGVKGGWINQSIKANYYDLIINHVTTSETGTEKLKNNFWGIGPQGGINSKWGIGDFKTNFFGFFGDFSIATMWGTWHCKDEYKNSLLKTSSVESKKLDLGGLSFKGFMGFEWKIAFKNDKSSFITKLGYEMQLWLNQLRIATFQLQRLHGDLTFQGITFNCQIVY